MFKAVLVFIPQLGDAIKWMNQHVKKYSINRDNNKIVITIDVDSDENASIVEPYLTAFMELLFERKPYNKH